MSAWAKAAKRLLTQPDFIVVVLLLGVAGVGLNAATGFMQLHFKKLPVQMAVDIDSKEGIPAVLGPWVQVSKDQPLNSETETVLGTTHYINREYVNTDVVGRKVVDSWVNLPPEERDQQLGKCQLEHPDAVIHFHVAYYTGLVDTVAHIPERCYLADGFNITNSQTLSDQKLGVNKDGQERSLAFRYITFDDQTDENRATRNVAYLFHVNGHYESDSLGVRRTLQNLREPYGYYAKVELMTVSSNRNGEVQDAAQAQSVEAVESFLRSALPEVERCLPDWQAVHAHPAK